MQAIQYQDATNMFHAQGTERLTLYELECGGIMQIDKGMKYAANHAPVAGVSLSLWKEPGCDCFHVRAHDFGKHERIFWDSFTTYTAASARYFRAKRALGM